MNRLKQFTKSLSFAARGLRYAIRNEKNFQNEVSVGIMVVAAMIYFHVTRAEMMLRSAMQAPQIHDLRAAYRNMYVEAGVDERKIEAILPPPQAAQPAPRQSGHIASGIMRAAARSATVALLVEPAPPTSKAPSSCDRSKRLNLASASSSSSASTLTSSPTSRAYSRRTDS